MYLFDFEPAGDVVEARAIRDVFKDHAHSGRLALSSTKVLLNINPCLRFLFMH